MLLALRLWVSLIVTVCGSLPSASLAHLPIAGSTRQPPAHNGSATDVGHGVSGGGTLRPGVPAPIPVRSVGGMGRTAHRHRAEHPAALPVEQGHFQHLCCVFAVPAIAVYVFTAGWHAVDPYVKAPQKRRSGGQKALWELRVCSANCTAAVWARWDGGDLFARFCIRNKLLLKEELRNCVLYQQL